ncbi:MAG TPA: CHAD domain-containing protein [Stellaceae bacterium]|nr:CHAD domain-containing protein [Stellaceae bacterium]
MTAEHALQEIARGCLAHLARNEAAALAGRAEAIHQMRIALRRLGTAVSAFKKMLPAVDRRWIEAELHALDAVLGRARNLDVFAGELVLPCRAALSGEAGFDALAGALERRREEAYREVEKRILSGSHKSAIARLARWFEERGWRRPEPSVALAAPLGEAAARLLDRRRREVKKRSRSFRRLSPGKRHKLRIAVKKLRYTLELLAGLYAKDDLAGFERRLKRLQDDLGYANDVRVGRALVAELGADGAAASSAAAGALVLAWHERRLEGCEARLRKHLRRLNERKPVWRAPAAGRDAQ